MRPHIIHIVLLEIYSRSLETYSVSRYAEIAFMKSTSVQVVRST